MFACLARAAAAQPSLWLLQCALPAVRRRALSSTPSDDLNSEMAAFFGADQPVQQRPRNGSPAPPASGAAQPQGRLASDVQSLNTELFGLFGRPQQGEQEAVPPLAQHLGGLAAQSAPAVAAPPPPRPYPRSTSASASVAAGDAGTSVPGDVDSGSSGSGAGLTHVDASGRATMVDVSEKPATVREATAAARVVLGPEVFGLVARNQLKKGDVLTVAQLAGVMGAKHTATLIPLCHNIALSRVHVSLSLAPAAAAVDVTATAATVGPTGVEMEALTAAAVAALCVYDMCKAASKGLLITDLRLLAKSGGRSGDWRRGEHGGEP